MNIKETDLEFVQNCFGEKKQVAGGLYLWEHGLQTALCLQGVLGNCEEDAGSEELVLSALGHDLLEDSDCTVDQIESLWGERVLQHIQTLTNCKGDGDFDEYIETLVTADDAVYVVKLSDICVNAERSLETIEDLMDSKSQAVDLDKARVRDLLEILLTNEDLLSFYKDFWMPLLRRYDTKLLDRTVTRYPKTAEFLTHRIRKTLRSLDEFFPSQGRGVRSST